MSPRGPRPCHLRPQHPASTLTSSTRRRSRSRWTWTSRMRSRSRASSMTPTATAAAARRPSRLSATHEASGRWPTATVSRSSSRTPCSTATSPCARVECGVGVACDRTSCSPSRAERGWPTAPAAAAEPALALVSEPSSPPLLLDAARVACSRDLEACVWPKVWHFHDGDARRARRRRSPRASVTCPRAGARARGVLDRRQPAPRHGREGERPSDSRSADRRERGAAADARGSAAGRPSGVSLPGKRPGAHTRFLRPR